MPPALFRSDLIVMTPRLTIMNLAATYDIPGLQYLMGVAELERWCSEREDLPDAGFWETQVALCQKAIELRRANVRALPPARGCFIDPMRVKELVDIVDLISQYIALKRHGHLYTGLCPFHSEKTPSFTVFPSGAGVSTAQPHYHCFGCEANGSVIDFMMQIKGLSYTGALRELAIIAGIPLPEHNPLDKAFRSWGYSVPGGSLTCAADD